ncbi:phosphoglycolate phosphatase [Sporothrix brasiliensis 5110]|uniref:Phosphoglycolate phosphatase n=1 Tax=Sporothrix brasiliensis 5110 TaxID=1398154 RepID=A0A0C2FBD9_9PEZI|nr:phosphoglycolate phosphatase [Sporothrix brasiliensis 5110]KIH88408.1 phosphoglycolate phosphatase [Sporothrix brasiliensis 5110]
MTINTILFDCDNTLVLSEELAFEGCADLLNEICEAKGVSPLPNFTGPTLITEFVGQNFRGMLTSLQSRYGFPLTADETNSYVLREEEVVIAKLRQALKPCVGVEPQLEALKAENKQLLAVVSSSALRRVKASLEVVKFDRFFAPDHVYSAATSLPTPTSKPDPAIYLHALKELGKTASEAVAVEDSRSGTLSATRAKIPTIGYVGPYAADKRTEMEKVLRDAGAQVIMQSWDEFPAKLEEISKL